MKNPRTGKTAVDDHDWLNLGDFVEASADFIGMSRTFVDIRFMVTDAQQFEVQIALTNDAENAPTTDDVVNTIQPGGYRDFSNVNLDLVWLKAPSGDSVLEFVGTPQ